MKCPNCNNELFEGTKACPFCSTAVEQAENDGTMPLNQPQDTAPFDTTEETSVLNQPEATEYQPAVNPVPQETYNQPPVNNQPQETYYQPPVNNQQGQYYQPPVENTAQGQYYQPPVQPQGAPQGNYYQPGFNQPPVNPADPYAQQYQQPDPIADANANSAKTLGIVAVVFAAFIPLVSWICGGIGLNKAKKVLYINPFHEKAKSAKTLCIVGIILGVVAWIINMIASQYFMDGIFDSLMY